MKALREAVERTVEAVYVAKSALYVDTCCGCGRQYRMFSKEADLTKPLEKAEYQDQQGPGYIYAEIVTNSDNKTHYVTGKVCSFQCAGKFMDGGWKDESRFDLSGRYSIISFKTQALTPWIMTGEELAKLWDAMPEDPAPKNPRVRW